MEFGYRCESWNNFYRTIYTRVSSDENQRLLGFARPDNVIVTNIGVNPTVLTNCNAREQRELIRAEVVIESYHMMGTDELPYRGLKDFGFEE